MEGPVPKTGLFLSYKDGSRGAWHPLFFVPAHRTAGCSLSFAGLARMEIIMRLDKYLKVSRLIKRRTVANEACDGGRVMINDKPAKASANVKEGDIITIQFGNKEVRVEVLNVQETVKKEEAKELFRYI